MTLRAGILGAGFMGKTHAGSLNAVDEVDVAAVCDVRMDSARALEESTAPGAAVYNSFDRMIAEARLDILYVCLPPFAHAEEVEKAAEKGIHLFLEKPIAIDSEKARTMVRAVEAAGIKSQVGFHMRFRESVQALKRMIDSGEAGRPALFTGRYWANMDGSPWWRDKSKSGGQVFEQVIHIYDLATHLFGEVTSCNGMIDNLCHHARDDYTIEDTSVGCLRFANGAMAVITGSNCAVPMHFFGDFRAALENMTLEYTCTGQTWVEPDHAALYKGDENKQEFIEDGNPYLLETLDFIRAIREDRPTRTPARDGLAAIEIVESAMKNGMT